jgi:hypothetical protein
VRHKFLIFIISTFDFKVYFIKCELKKLLSLMASNLDLVLSKKFEMFDTHDDW